MSDCAVCNNVAISSSGTLHELLVATFATWGIACSTGIAFRKAVQCQHKSPCAIRDSGWPL